MNPARSPAPRHPAVRRPPRLRSRVTNGRKLFVEGDGRSPWARRFRDLCAGHAGDLGGSDLLSESQMSLIRRASAIECELEQMEGRLSSGEAVDLDVFARVASHLRRLLETLGLERRPRDVEDLGAYLRRTYGDRGETEGAEAAGALPSRGDLAESAEEKDEDAAESHPTTLPAGEKSLASGPLKPIGGPS